MRIAAFSVTNYKSFRQTERMALGPGFNVVVGQNNAGKSALVEALGAQFSTPARAVPSSPPAARRRHCQRRSRPCLGRCPGPPPARRMVPTASTAAGSWRPSAPCRRRSQRRRYRWTNSAAGSAPASRTPTFPGSPAWSTAWPRTAWSPSKRSDRPTTPDRPRPPRGCGCHRAPATRDRERNPRRAVPRYPVPAGVAIPSMGAEWSIAGSTPDVDTNGSPRAARICCIASISPCCIRTTLRASSSTSG